MEMFLMIACMSMFALGIMAAAFGAATRSGEAEPQKPKPDPAASLPVPQFFVDYSVSPRVTETQVPVEVLLMQIENHVRLEHAAAQSFLSAPSPDLLHSRTISPLVQ